MKNKYLVVWLGGSREHMTIVNFFWDAAKAWERYNQLSEIVETVIIAQIMQESDVLQEDD